MSVIEIKSKDQFDELLSSNDIVAIQATASWCGPCKAIRPIFDKGASENTVANKYAFGRFDTDEVPDLASEFGIRSIPAFFFFQRGEKADSLVGVNPGALNKLIDTYSAQAQA